MLQYALVNPMNWVIRLFKLNDAGQRQHMFDQHMDRLTKFMLGFGDAVTHSQLVVLESSSSTILQAASIFAIQLVNVRLHCFILSLEPFDSSLSSSLVVFVASLSHLATRPIKFIFSPTFLVHLLCLSPWHKPRQFRLNYKTKFTA